MENISNNLCSICHEEINPPLTTESSRTLLMGLRAFARRIQKKEVLTKLLCGHEFHYGCIKTWANKNPRCPMDRRLITNAPFISVNMRKELLRSVKGGQIDNVREILHEGFNPNQRSFTNRKNPLSISLKQQHWEISAELIRAGATTRNKTAQNNLGYMYRNGLGVEPNHTEAVTWYRKAADQGHAAAQNNLGYMYRNGLGVEPNHTEAVTWYRKAADQGFAAAQNNLGYMYRNGLGVEPNHTEAVTWYRKAADQGHAAAQNNLGYMHQNGLGVDRGQGRNPHRPENPPQRG